MGCVDSLFTGMLSAGARDGTRLSPRTPDQLAQFLGANISNGRYPLWRLTALTRLRRGETIGLQWRDVDFEARTLRVGRAVAVVDGELTVGKPKSR